MADTKLRINEVDSTQYTLLLVDGFEMTRERRRRLEQDAHAGNLTVRAILPTSDRGIQYESCLLQRDRDFMVFGDDRMGLHRRLVLNLRSGKIRVYNLDPVTVPETLTHHCYRDEIGDLCRRLRDAKVGDLVSVELCNWQCYDMQIMSVAEDGWMYLSRTMPHNRVQRCRINKLTGRAHEEGKEQSDAYKNDCYHSYRVRYFGDRRGLERKVARMTRYSKQHDLMNSIIGEIRYWLCDTGIGAAWSEERVSEFMKAKVYERTRKLPQRASGQVDRAVEDMRRLRNNCTCWTMVREDGVRLPIHQLGRLVNEYRDLKDGCSCFTYYQANEAGGRFIFIPISEDDRQKEIAASRLTVQDIDLVANHHYRREDNGLVQLYPSPNRSFRLAQATEWVPPPTLVKSLTFKGNTHAETLTQEVRNENAQRDAHTG